MPPAILLLMYNYIKNHTIIQVRKGGFIIYSVLAFHLAIVTRRGYPDAVIYNSEFFKTLFKKRFVG